MEHHLTTTECHLPYGITQCYLLPDTSERTPPSPDSGPNDLLLCRAGRKTLLTHQLTFDSTRKTYAATVNMVTGTERSKAIV